MSKNKLELRLAASALSENIAPQEFIRRTYQVLGAMQGYQATLRYRCAGNPDETAYELMVCRRRISFVRGSEVLLWRRLGLLSKQQRSQCKMTDAASSLLRAAGQCPASINSAAFTPVNIADIVFPTAQL